MSKAREYLDDGDLLKTADSALVEMNHKTLEDVGELVGSIRYQDPAVQVFYEELKTGLEKLKL